MSNGYDDFDDEVEATRALSLDDMPGMDDEVEATRALDITDLPTADEMVPPPPPSAHRAPPPPAPSMRETLVDEEMNEDATRVLDAMTDVDDLMEGYGQQVIEEPPGTTIELRVVEGPDRGKIHEVLDGEYLVGRGLTCTIVLGDPAVSRKHFRLVREGDDVECIDMGGANGTKINGQLMPTKVLEPGDRLEVGTTVLEFFVEGAEVSRPAPEDYGDVQEQVEPAKKKGPLLLLVGCAFLFVLLAGGGTAAYLLLGDSDGDQGETEAGSDGGDQLKSAQDLMDDGKWSEAIKILKKARASNKDNKEIKSLLNQAQDESEAADLMEDGEEAMSKKDYGSALQAFADVPKSSESYRKAQERHAAAKEALVGQLLQSAKDLMEAGDGKKAGKPLKALLKLDPDHAEGKLLQAKVGGGEATPQKNPFIGKKSKELLKLALKAYHDQDFKRAQLALQTLAKGKASGKDKRKAAAYLTSITAVAEGLQAGKTGKKSKLRAEAYKKAYEADQEVDGHFHKMLGAKVVKAYISAARFAYKSRRYGDAAEILRNEVELIDFENAEAMALSEKCKKKAKKLLVKAKELAEKQDYATAYDKAREVTRILSGMSPEAAEAVEIMKKTAGKAGK